jgi:hypothetical protein
MPEWLAVRPARSAQVLNGLVDRIASDRGGRWILLLRDQLVQDGEKPVDSRGFVVFVNRVLVQPVVNPRQLI